MQFRKLTLAFFLLFCWTLQAQNEFDKSGIPPCGTAPEIDPIIKKYYSNSHLFSENNADTLYAGVQVHLLANDNGGGRFSAEKLLNAFCRLNTDFEPSEIQFYFKNDWNLLDNSAWYQHDSLKTGIQMMLVNDVPGVHNAYFVADPAGNCGYNLPYASVAIQHGCAGPNSHTWSHELGHALGLPHPFIGWEGKVYNFNIPTPDTLTYNYTHFHSSPDTIDPAPLDTALVEYLDGSNCGIAADRICDTKPDYLSYGWNCNAQGASTVQQKDPNGATFFSDGSLYMSYSNDACQNRFSPDEIQIMRAKLQTVKAAWLATGPQGADITSLPELVAPLNGDPAPSTGALLQWKSVPGATHYLVQASRISSFGIKEFEHVVTDTFAMTSAFLPNLTYYWRVRPFNFGHTCTGFTANGKFLSTVVNSVQSAGDAGWRIYPSLLNAGQKLVLETPDNWMEQAVNCQVFDAAGRLVWQAEQYIGASKQNLELPSAQWKNGTYYFVCTGKPGVVRQTLTFIGN